MIREIREKSLHKRIPLNKNKDELHNLTTSLNSMFDRLEHSFNQQREFIGNAAHELKTPLTILILGHEEMLSSNLPVHQTQELEKQLSNLNRLNKLVRDLLSIARLEQQDSLQRELTDISLVISNSLDDFSDIIKAKRINVLAELPSYSIMVDKDKIQRLFINLIDNGIKYNLEQDGQLIVRVNGAEDKATITVSNTGEQLSEEDSQLIFKQFYRVEKSRSQTYGGSGLGLTIAHRIVEMHGGKISVKSDDKSTTFTISLPRPE